VVGAVGDWPNRADCGAMIPSGVIRRGSGAGY